MIYKTKAKLKNPVTEIEIETDEIKLSGLLKFAGICATGGEANVVILSGGVRINGKVCDQRSKKVQIGDLVQINGVYLKVVKKPS